LEDKVQEHEVKTRYKVNKDAQTNHLDIAVEAFEAIGWKVPRLALAMFYAGEARDLLEEYTTRLIWYTGCSHMKKPREFYITSSIGMKPPTTRIKNGVVIYTSLPITLDDKVDKLQSNYDYQQHMEEHQLSLK
jgi:hypothetical protein